MIGFLAHDPSNEPTRSVLYIVGARLFGFASFGPPPPSFLACFRSFVRSRPPVRPFGGRHPLCWHRPIPPNGRSCWERGPAHHPPLAHKHVHTPTHESTVWGSLRTFSLSYCHGTFPPPRRCCCSSSTIFPPWMPALSSPCFAASHHTKYTRTHARRRSSSHPCSLFTLSPCAGPRIPIHHHPAHLNPPPRFHCCCCCCCSSLLLLSVKPSSH